jgi:hypothetical protein
MPSTVALADSHCKVECVLKSPISRLAKASHLKVRGPSANPSVSISHCVVAQPPRPLRASIRYHILYPAALPMNKS